jgi:hypothetical protein
MKKSRVVGYALGVALVLVFVFIVWPIFWHDIQVILGRHP